MNARIAKLALILCSLSLLNFAAALKAQDTNADGGIQAQRLANRRAAEAEMESLPEFNIQIENGELSLAYFKRREQTNPWGTTNSTVPATVDNLSKYLRAIDPNLNIVLSPDAGNFVIPNLKLTTRNPFSISQAVNIASGGTIAGSEGGRMGGGFGGGLRIAERNLTFISNQRHENKSSVEVFNLSGYIQTLGNVDEKAIKQKLDELENLIFPTLDNLHIIKTPDDVPTFKYHPGTKLLIVIGKPEAIEVTRKIIDALSGQQKNGKDDVRLDTPPPSDQN